MTKPWKDHKANILRLYIEEGRTLADVRVIMERDYGFEASVRSYRQHFDDWKVGKYNCRRRQSRHQIGSSPESSPPLRSAMPIRKHLGGGHYFHDRPYTFDATHPRIKQELLSSDPSDEDYRAGATMPAYPTDTHSGYRLMPPRDNAMMRPGSWEHPDWQVPRALHRRSSEVALPHMAQYPGSCGSGFLPPSPSSTHAGSVFSYGSSPPAEQYHHQSPPTTFQQGRDLYGVEAARGFSDARDGRLSVADDDRYRSSQSYGWAGRDGDI
jgi:hypothetical protein